MGLALAAAGEVAAGGVPRERGRRWRWGAYRCPPVASGEGTAQPGPTRATGGRASAGFTAGGAVSRGAGGGGALSCQVEGSGGARAAAPALRRGPSGHRGPGPGPWPARSVSGAGEPLDGPGPALPVLPGGTVEPPPLPEGLRRGTGVRVGEEGVGGQGRSGCPGGWGTVHSPKGCSAPRPAALEPAGSARPGGLCPVTNRTA